VARYRHLKWGCFISGYDCENCALAKKQGKCNQTGSISHFWQYVLLQDSQEEVDETLQKDMKETLDRIWLA
jgi:predicted ATP-dependent serine protease